MRDVASRELEPVAEKRAGTPGPVPTRHAEARDAAFEALFRLHQRAVRGWILRIVRDSGGGGRT